MIKAAAATSRKTVHTVALLCGAAGLLSVYLIHNQYLLLLSMVGVGIAWASILSMPYAMLSSALPPARIGVYMGVFNLSIVLPQLVVSLGIGAVIGRMQDKGGIFLICAASLALSALAWRSAAPTDAGDDEAAQPGSSSTQGRDHVPHAAWDPRCHGG